MIITYCLIAMFCTGLLCGLSWKGLDRVDAKEWAQSFLYGALWPLVAIATIKLWKEGKL